MATSFLGAFLPDQTSHAVGPGEPTTDTFEIRHSRRRPTLATGVLLGLIGVAFVCVGLFGWLKDAGPNSSDALRQSGLVGILLGCPLMIFGAWAAFATWRYRIRVTTHGIELRSMLGTTRFLAFDNIRRIAYVAVQSNPANFSLLVWGPERIRFVFVPPTFIGYDRLARRLREVRPDLMTPAKGRPGWTSTAGVFRISPATATTRLGSETRTEEHQDGGASRISRTWADEPERSSGDFEVIRPWRGQMGTAGAVLMVVGLAMASWAIVTDTGTGNAHSLAFSLVTVVLGGAVGLVGLHSLLTVFVFRIRATADGMEVRSPWGMTRRLAYRDIRRIARLGPRTRTAHPLHQESGDLAIWGPGRERFARVPCWHDSFADVAARLGAARPDLAAEEPDERARGVSTGSGTT